MGLAIFRSLCISQNFMSYPRCSYHALFGAIPNNCSTWSYSKLLLHYMYPVSLYSELSGQVSSLHRRNLYDELFYHLHNREKFLSPVVTKNNLERCPVSHSWVTLVPPSWLLARHNSGGGHNLAYPRGYRFRIGGGLRSFSLFCRGRALSLNFVPYNSGKNFFFD